MISVKKKKKIIFYNNKEILLEPQSSYFIPKNLGSNVLTVIQAPHLKSCSALEGFSTMINA